MDKNNNHKRDESCGLEDFDNLDPDRSEILPNNVIKPQDEDHVSGPLPYRQLSPLSESGPATYDTLSQPPKSQLGEGDPHERHRKS